MKKKVSTLLLTLAIIFFVTAPAYSQQSSTIDSTKPSADKNLKTFIIEREIPGAGSLTPEQLKNISQTSCTVLREMGPTIQWVHSYVTGNKVFCVYKATNKDLILEHAKKGGFPANQITEIVTTISPNTAN